MFVSFRRHTLRPLDDGLYALRASIAQLSAQRGIGAFSATAFPCCLTWRATSKSARSPNATPLVSFAARTFGSHRSSHFSPWVRGQCEGRGADRVRRQHARILGLPDRKGAQSMGAGIKDDILTALDLASLEQRLRGAPSNQSDLGGFADKLACRLQCHLCRASRADLGKGASVVTDRAGFIATFSQRRANLHEGSARSGPE
jgi:hypothetical protein